MEGGGGRRPGAEADRDWTTTSTAATASTASTANTTTTRAGAGRHTHTHTHTHAHTHTHVRMLKTHTHTRTHTNKHTCTGKPTTATHTLGNTRGPQQTFISELNSNAVRRHTAGRGPHRPRLNHNHHHCLFYLLSHLVILFLSSQFPVSQSISLHPAGSAGLGRIQEGFGAG